MVDIKYVWQVMYMIMYLDNQLASCHGDWVTVEEEKLGYVWLLLFVVVVMVKSVGYLDMDGCLKLQDRSWYLSTWLKTARLAYVKQGTY